MEGTSTLMNPVLLGHWVLIESVLDLDNHFHFNSYIAGKGSHAHCGTGVFAPLPKHLHHQIGIPIDDFGLVRKFRGGIDHAQDLYDSFDPIEISQFRLEGGELV